MHRAVAEVDHLLRMPQSITAVGARPFMTGIGGGDGIPERQRQPHLVVVDLAGLPAVTDRHDLAVPGRRSREPHFDLDRRVARRPDRGSYPAECRDVPIGTSRGPRFWEKPAGGLNAPGATEAAIVTVVCCNDKRTRSSQVAACREASAAKTAAAANAKRTVRRMGDPTIGSFLVGAVDYRGGGAAPTGQIQHNAQPRS